VSLRRGAHLRLWRRRSGGGATKTCSITIDSFKQSHMGNSNSENIPIHQVTLSP
jgi:hypothetical protein